MNRRRANTALPLVRISSFLRYVRYLESVGAPVGRLLARAGIPEMLLDYPASAVPQESAFRFGDLVCRALGTEHIGLHMTLAGRLEDLGSYGAVLQRSLTLHEYLRKGVALYNLQISGQRLWLSTHGAGLRLNVATDGGTGVAAYQSHLETLAVTIIKIREVAGADWSPREIGLAYKAREGVPDVELFAGSRILRGTAESYVSFPRRLLAEHFPNAVGERSTWIPASPDGHPLPKCFGDAVRLQIETLLPARAYPIETIAETLSSSTRSLQRRLAKEGLTYSQLLAETRVRVAANRLKNTDMPVGEIAFDLGYTNASNFTRAFRAQTGVSPQVFRDNAKRNAGRRP
jgi:AraC-like DNA-binding protein